MRVDVFACASIRRTKYKTYLYIYHTFFIYLYFSAAHIPTSNEASCVSVWFSKQLNRYIPTTYKAYHICAPMKALSLLLVPSG